MIHGAHVIIYSKDSEADRAFFRDVLKYESVDAGHGWNRSSREKRGPRAGRIRQAGILASSSDGSRST